MAERRLPTFLCFIHLFSLRRKTYEAVIHQSFGRAPIATVGVF